MRTFSRRRSMAMRWRVVGTDRLFDTEAEALRHSIRLLEEQSREHPEWILSAKFVMPWWNYSDGTELPGSNLKGAAR